MKHLQGQESIAWLELGQDDEVLLSGVIVTVVLVVVARNGNKPVCMRVVFIEFKDGKPVWICIRCEKVVLRAIGIEDERRVCDSW